MFFAMLGNCGAVSACAITFSLFECIIYALYMHPVCPYNNCSQRFSLRELRFSPVVISKKRTSNLISSKCIKFAQSIFQSQIKEITLGSSPNVNYVTAQQGEKVMRVDITVPTPWHQCLLPANISEQLLTNEVLFVIFSVNIN